MKAYSEDLRQKIVQAVGRGMSKSQAARLFDVSLSSAKRYARLARERSSLSPKKRGGRPPKVDEDATKLLEDQGATRESGSVYAQDSLLGRHSQGACSNVQRS